jgi:glycosyltransferase involved in cell wall biosynthesis
LSAIPRSGRHAVRLALVLWNGDVGGAEVLTVSLARQMRALGADARVLLIGGSGALTTRLDDSEVPYRALGFTRGREVLRHPRRYAAAVAEAGADGALLIECGFMGGALKLGGYRGAIVGAEHGAILELPDYGRRRRMLWRLARISGAWADDAEVAVSRSILARVRDHPHAQRLRMIYNGIEVSRFGAVNGHSPLRARDDFTVGFAGRLIPGKGCDHLIRAIARLAEAHPVKAAVAGEGPERTRLESLARDLGVEENVRFLGLTHDLPSFWADADVAVVPSAEFTEACPMAPLEAMAAGRPVVATRNGGLGELVIDGETGLLVAPGDADALASALARYAQDRRLAAVHGAAGASRVAEHHGIATCATAYLELFGELV